MAKKRVHEIAKEIKAQGIDLKPTELLNELQALDFPVKSHSSTLDEDLANAAVEKILRKHKPQTPVVKAAGFVVRRKAPSPVPAPVAPIPRPPIKRAAPPVADAPREAAQTLQVEAAPAVVPPIKRVPMPATVAIEPPRAERQPEPDVGIAEATTSVAATASEPSRIQAAESPSTEVAAKPAVDEAPAMAASAAPQAAQEPPTTAPRALEPKREVVVTGAPTTKTPGLRPKPAAQLPQPAQVDPRTLRPTANQAVVISRPLIPIRRVTPPTSSDPSKRIPQAPGPRAIGPVRELTVGTNHLGRREFTDVSRDQQAKKRTTGARQEIKENLSKQELVDLARGRTTLPPLRAGKKRKPVKKGVKTQITQMSEEKKVIKIDETISVAELSQTIGVKANELIRKLMGLGTMVTINSPLDVDTVTLLAGDYGWRVEKTGFEIENYISDTESAPEDLVSRPPVVTIMGHVDHGKTSLLDAIRHSRVAAGEAGGITQAIGAYSVQTEAGQYVTFLDTPGHEAFTAMRARGAKVTDLVVIVVAADDGVMPQTREAINHAKAAEVPILVAINKIDKPGANPQHVKNQLMEFGLIDESLGGETIMVPVSAKTKVGLDSLLEMILLQSEVLDLKANPNRKAKGTVVEAKLDKGRGPVATVIVAEGTLRVGDAIVTGTQSGKIRAMQNDRGEKIEEVLPGFPAEIVGLAGVPDAGDEFDVVESDAAAKEIASHRFQKEREKELTKSAKVRLEDLFSKASEGALKELKLVIKADVQGSAEAVSDALKKLSTSKVAVDVIHAGVGGINGNDVMLASASNAIIVGFNVRPELKAAEMAQQQGVDIRLYTIIYEAVDEVQKAMEGLLEPTRREKLLGHAEVRNIFTVPKVGTIAGCFITDGKIMRSSQVRLLRDSKVIYTGKIGSLRRFKDDVREVEKGYECGLSIENFADIKQGDVVEAFEIEIIQASLT
ncbi:MAG: translation initiation factor IF-2 [Myxococcales bacterium]|jgi:translation initiation factor IF-2|nr:translation initiation factor IF-2 [Myxococcales bacterium]